MLGYGKKMGDMSVDTMDYEYPQAGYAGNQEGKTTEYQSRQNRIVTEEAREIEKKNYRGRYE